MARRWISAHCAVMIMNEAPLVLALDTSTVVNVGLARGDQVLATATVADQMAHVEQLMPLVSECVDAAGIRMADLDQLIVGLGPGPFTGLRVGVVTAQVLSYALGLRAAWRLQSRRTGRTICWSKPWRVRGRHRCEASRGVLGALQPSRRTARAAQGVTSERCAATARHRTRGRPLRRSAASRARSAIDGSRGARHVRCDAA